MVKPDRETLRRLYEDERLTTRQIGKKYDVAHITIRRWLGGYGIPLRASGKGLANRGVAAPTATELHNLVHVQHLGYREIAKLYGVDFTAVPSWLDKAGVERPTVWGTRRKGRAPTLPSPEDLRRRRGLGESATSIAESCGVNRSTITSLCQSHGIPVDRDGWQGGKRHQCNDGHEARSLYELRVDNWLHAHGLTHETEPRYPFDARYRADFLVGSTFIEVWGVTNNQAYLERKRKKIRLCKENDLKLLQIHHWQFRKGTRWWKQLAPLLDDSPAKRP